MAVVFVTRAFGTYFIAVSFIIHSLLAFIIDSQISKPCESRTV